MYRKERAERLANVAGGFVAIVFWVFGFTVLVNNDQWANTWTVLVVLIAPIIFGALVWASIFNTTLNR